MPYVNVEDQRKHNREYFAKWYRQNKELHKKRVKRNTLSRREDAHRIIDEVKSVPCADCKQTFDPICMDFDHVGEDKTAGISQMVTRGKSLEIILLEIAKCEIVCSNCHRIRTRNRRLNLVTDEKASLA